jgi:hypothetical protein
VDADPFMSDVEESCFLEPFSTEVNYAGQSTQPAARRTQIRLHAQPRVCNVPALSETRLCFRVYETSNGRQVPLGLLLHHPTKVPATRAFVL